MTDRVVQSYLDSAERARQPLHSYQSHWMSHWSGASCNTALQERNRLSSPLGKDEVDHGAKQRHMRSGVVIASDNSGSAKGFGEVKARNFEFINESLKMSSRNLRNDRPSSQDSPMVAYQKSGSSLVCNYDQETNDMQVSKHQSTANFDHGTAALCTSGRHFPSNSVAPLATETSSKECHIQRRSVSQNPNDLVKTHKIFGSTIGVTRSSQDNFTGTASHIFPQGFNLKECRFDRGSSMPSLLSRQEKVDHLRTILASKKHLSETNLTILEQEKGNHHSNSTFLVGKKCMNNRSTSAKSVKPYIRNDDSSLILHDSSTNNIHSPAFCKEQYQRVQNHSSSGLFSSWSSPPEMTKLGTVHRGCCLHTKPSSAHDVKTLRICTSMDFVEGGCGNPPRIAEATSSLVITKRTEINLFKESQSFRESGVFGQLKGNPSCELHSFSQPCGQSKGVKLQLLGSSTEGEGKENVQNINAFEVDTKKKLSAESDTVDTDNFKRNHLSGENSSSRKDVMKDADLPSNDAISSAGEEVRRRRPIPELPDINIPVAENVDSSTSRTLDMNQLHTEPPDMAKSNQQPDGHLGPDFSSRWIKRLKPSASGSSSLGTKSMKLGEASSHEKVNKSFSKVVKDGITNSEQTLDKRAGKELLVLDQKTTSVRKDESSSVDNVEKGDEITLSHPWIQRWCHNRAATPQKKPEAKVVCDPQSSKVTSEDSRKKQLPSIAAMALMGRVINGCQPCELEDRGTYIVWKTL